MAKPAPGTPLDTGHALYGALRNAWGILETSGITLTDSKAGDGATLGGTAALATDGGGEAIVRVTSGVGSAAFASSVVFANTDSYSLFWEAKQAASDNNGMVAGNGSNFLWMLGGNTVQLRGNDQSWTLGTGDTTVMAKYALTVNYNAGTVTLKLYRNGTLIGTAGTGAAVTLNTFLNGFGTSFPFIGDLKRFFTFNRDLTSTEVSDLTTNTDALWTGSSPLSSGTASTVSVGNTIATVTVGNATGGTAPYTYQWYRSTTSGFTPGGGNILSGATSQTLNDTGLTNGTTYYYKNVVTDSAGTPATATSNQASATPANITTYDLTDTTIAGVFVQVEGGATLGTFGGSTAWGQSSSNWTDGSVHFKLAAGAGAVTVEVETWNNGAVIRTAKDLADVDHGTATTGSNAYVWTTVATGLDASAGPDVVLSWGMTMFVRKVRVTNATIATAYLPARKVLAGYGDSITLGQAGTGGDSTLSWLHLAGLSLDMQVLNRGIGSTAVVGPGTTGEGRTADVTGGGGLPNPDVLILLYGTNDAGAGTSQGTFGVSELHMLRQLQTGLPSTTIVVERLLKTGVGDTTRDAYSTTIAAQVSALNCPRVTYAQGMYGAYDGSDGVHPAPGAHMTAIAAAAVADVPAAGGGAAAFAPIGCGFIRGI